MQTQSDLLIFRREVARLPDLPPLFQIGYCSELCGVFLAMNLSHLRDEECRDPLAKILVKALTRSSGCSAGEALFVVSALLRIPVDLYSEHLDKVRQIYIPHMGKEPIASLYNALKTNIEGYNEDNVKRNDA